MRTIYIQSCSKLKNSAESEAYLLYSSSLFIKIRDYIIYRTAGDLSNYYILSAKYGLINSAEIISPYDSTMGTRTQIITVNKLYFQLKDLNIGNDCEVISFCGNAYRSILKKAGLRKMTNFFAGVGGIGKQLQFINKELAKCMK